METTLAAEALKQGVLGFVILGLVYGVVTLYRRVEQLTKELIEVSKLLAASNERVAGVVQESTTALRESTDTQKATAELNAQLRAVLERRGRS